MKEDNSGPAFPVVGFQLRNNSGMDMIYDNGMSLRDYFAAAALQGQISAQKKYFGSYRG